MNMMKKCRARKNGVGCADARRLIQEKKIYNNTMSGQDATIAMTRMLVM
jgi:hypothetical protein